MLEGSLLIYVHITKSRNNGMSVNWQQLILLTNTININIRRYITQQQEILCIIVYYIRWERSKTNSLRPLRGLHKIKHNSIVHISPFLCLHFFAVKRQKFEQS
uniref:Uncharacterized protein n=1 Tax=Cacopsylla melanoneura TaxID=428564 RepID=A0A8D8ZF80_9HEMI